MDRALVRATKQIEASNSVDAIWSLIVDALRLNGITHVLYITVASKPPIEPFIRSNMPLEWTRAFKGNMEHFDPFLEYCCSTYHITLTGVEFIDTHPYLDDQAKAFIHAASDIGFRSGLGIPMRLLGAARYGGFNLGNGLSRAEFEEQILPASETKSCRLRRHCVHSASSPTAGSRS